MYDLGNVDARAVKAPRAVRKVPARPTGLEQQFVTPPPLARGWNWPASLSLFLPGSGHLATGRLAEGVFVLTTLGFLGAMSWALIVTMPRLVPTLEILGLPTATGFWALGAAFAMVAGFHVIGVVSVEPQGRTGTHPVIAGAASLVVPGWGQVLNGHRLRAALILAMVWLAGFTWILTSGRVSALLATHGLALPRALAAAAHPAVRWTLPALLWTLAVYDAITGARANRRERG